MKKRKGYLFLAIILISNSILFGCQRAKQKESDNIFPIVKSEKDEISSSTQEDEAKIQNLYFLYENNQMVVMQAGIMECPLLTSGYK